MQVAQSFVKQSLPYYVGSLDLDDPGSIRAVAQAIVSGGAGGALLVLRRAGAPVDETIINGCDGAGLEAVAEVLEGLVTRGDLEPGREGVELLSPPDIPGPGPSLAVVICTRDRPAGLERCLVSLDRQRDKAFSVVVVDNSSSSAFDVASVCERFVDNLALTYVREPVAGLSRARNAALGVTGVDVLAWIDDDEEADETWVGTLRGMFRSRPAVAVVLGRMLPARVSSPVDVLFEEFGGHNKGSNRTETVFTRSELKSRRFYPLPAFGTGGNMAFRKEVIAAVGGFDTCLGAGSACHAGEDTLFLSEALDRGFELCFAPTVITWHHHRASESELVSQFLNYGMGLGGFFMALVCNRWGRLLTLMALLPGALVDLFATDSVRNEGASEALVQVRSGNRWAIVRGASRYLFDRSRRRWSP